MWRKSGTKLQGRYPATPSGGFMLGLDEFVYLAKSNLNLTIWLVQMHSKLASLVRNNIWTCQIVKFALDFAKNTNPSRPSINPPVGVAGSVLIYIKMPKMVYFSEFWKPAVCGQTVLPDRSLLIGQKLGENAKISKNSNATFWVILNTVASAHQSLLEEIGNKSQYIEKYIL